MALSENSNRPSGGLEDSEHELQKRGLTAPVRAQDGKKLPLFDAGFTSRRTSCPS